MAENLLDSDQGAQIYHAQLRALAESISVKKSCKKPYELIEKKAPTCGSALILKLNIQDGKIAHIGHDVEACLLTRAVLAVFHQVAIGKTRDEIYVAYIIFKGWLGGSVEQLPPAWQKLNNLTPAKEYTARHKSMLLPFTATLDIFSQRGKITE